MLQRLAEPVQVVFAQAPLALTFGNREYRVREVGLHHRYRHGLVLHHVYSVLAGDLFFRLNLNTESMLWALEEVSDGLPD